MGQYIDWALESVSKQTTAQWELIAVDDHAPSDGTKEKLQAFRDSHPNNRVDCIRHYQNRGVSAARNTAIKQARGDYVAFLDPDDYWGQEFLEKTTRVLDGGEVDVVVSRPQIVSANGKLLSLPIGPTKKDIDEFPRSLYRRNFIAPVSVLLRRTALPSPQPFDERPGLSHVEDWDLWLSLIYAGARFQFIHDEAISYYRVHSGGGSKVGRSEAHRRIHSLILKHSQRTELVEGLLANIEGDFIELTNSVSWKVGRSLTWPLRRIADFWR